MGTTAFVLTHLTCKLAFLYFLYSIAHLYTRAVITTIHYLVYHWSDSNSSDPNSPPNGWAIFFDLDSTNGYQNQNHSCYIPPPMSDPQGRDFMVEVVFWWAVFTVFTVIIRRFFGGSKTPVMARNYKTSFCCLISAILFHAVDLVVSALGPPVYYWVYAACSNELANPSWKRLYTAYETAFQTHNGKPGWEALWWVTWLAVWFMVGIWPLESIDQGGCQEVPAVAIERWIQGCWDWLGEELGRQVESGRWKVFGWSRKGKRL